MLRCITFPMLFYRKRIFSRPKLQQRRFRCSRMWRCFAR